jgi:hypothetical protein
MEQQELSEVALHQSNAPTLSLSALLNEEAAQQHSLGIALHEQPHEAMSHGGVPISAQSNSNNNSSTTTTPHLSPTTSPRERLQCVSLPHIGASASQASVNAVSGLSHSAPSSSLGLQSTAIHADGLANPLHPNHPNPTSPNANLNSNAHINSQSSNSSAAWRSVPRPSLVRAPHAGATGATSPRAEKEAKSERKEREKGEKDRKEKNSSSSSSIYSSIHSEMANHNNSSSTSLQAEVQQHFLEQKVEKLTRRWSDKRGRGRIDKLEKGEKFEKEKSERIEKTVEWEKETEERAREKEKEREREYWSHNNSPNDSTTLRDMKRSGGEAVEKPGSKERLVDRAVLLDSPRGADKHVIRTSPQSSGEVPLPSPTSAQAVSFVNTATNAASSTTLAASLATLLPNAITGARGASSSPSPPTSKQSSGEKLIRLSGGPASEHRKRSNSERGGLRGSSERVRGERARLGEERMSPQGSGDFLVSINTVPRLPPHLPSQSLSSESTLIFTRSKSDGIENKNAIGSNMNNNNRVALSGSGTLGNSGGGSGGGNSIPLSLHPSQAGSPSTSPLRTRAGSGGVSLTHSGPLRSRAGSRGSAGRVGVGGLFGVPPISTTTASSSSNNNGSGGGSGNNSANASPSKLALDQLRASGALVPLPTTAEWNASSPSATQHTDANAFR